MPILSRIVVAVTLLLSWTVGAPDASAQSRERPVPFDDAGRVAVITPPLAARLGLAAPVWPVTGDYLDARLYALDDSAGPTGSFVLVVRRQQEVLERTPIDAARRRALADAIARGEVSTRIASGPDSMPTYVSEPVRGSFIFNQTMLGLFLYGPAAAVMVQDGAGSSAAYLLVAGGTFFTSAALTSSQPVSRSQNHLSWHSARRGAMAANLAVYALGGGDADGRTYAAATLAGGIAGDVIGFQLAKPMTDAEAHGTSHGSTITAALAAGASGVAGMYENRGSGRAASAIIIGAGALGYPLGLRYVRDAPYRVTAGDVGTLVTAEWLGLGVAATLIPETASREVGYGLLTAGFAMGAIAGDRLLVRPFDHTESEARLLALGAGAGALMGLALPVLAQTDNSHVLFGAATIGGILGAVVSQGLLAPHRVTTADRGDAPGRTGAGGEVRRPRVDVRFAPEGVVLAGVGRPGQHSIVSLSF
jgi:hypothetical protein